MSTKAIAGSRVGIASKRNRRFEPGRTCSYEGCETKLSVYNPQDRCWLHRSFKAPRLRGKTVLEG
ncbi:MAG: hypothetical protein M3164_05835 [Actinomycetota bacterium]|nr:hypothetical protein [Actinomycetota bacterium]